MSLKENMPFNIDLLFINEGHENVPFVTSLDILEGSTKNFHPQGLFSTEIFGKVGEPRRKSRFAKIDLKLKVLHPQIYLSLVSLKQMYSEIIAGKLYAKFDEQTKDFIKSTPEDGGTGYSFFMSYLDKLEFEERKSDRRMFNIRLVRKFIKQPYVSKFIVLPAGYRDYTVDSNGKPSQDEINSFYTKMIALSNLVNEATIKLSPESVDGIRLKMQMVVVELYNYLINFLKGKKKFTLRKWLSRQIFYGTGNVISSVIEEIDDIDSPTYIRANETGVGVYQYIKAAEPLVVYNIRSGFVGKVFRDINQPAILTNPKTFRSELVNLPPNYFDEWMSIEGLNRVLNRFGEAELRNRPVMVNGYYMGLLYFNPTTNEFRLLHGVDELPEDRDPKMCSPVTFGELMYISIYGASKGKFIFNTRYPAANYGNIYPSYVHLKSTIRSTIARELDEFWQPLIHIAPHFPIRGERYIDTISPAFSHLARMGGDYDGDKIYSHMLLCDESNAECEQLLSDKRYYLAPNKTLYFSSETDTSKFILSCITK